MKSFFDWFREHSIDPLDPWLILGKGPSFARRDEFDLSVFRTIGLNHVCREHKVMVTHIIDLDVVDDLGDSIEQSSEVLVMPWVPHVKNDPMIPLLQYETKLSDKNLGALAFEHPVLRRLEDQSRLLYYNLSTARETEGDSPVVRVHYFSVEAALNLLVEAGVKKVRSLGIDGGTAYSADFQDLEEKTLLANKRSSFDKQFEELAKTIATRGIDFAPLGVESPIRVFVAATEAQMLSVKVLEWSIRKHASMNVEVIPLHETGIEIPIPRDPENRPRTPFSFQRFLIPRAAGYCGRAIYLDSDMQLFKDIRMLWTTPFEGAEVLAACEPGESGRKPQFSVMLLDCDRLRWEIGEIVGRLDRREITYRDLMEGLLVARTGETARRRDGETAPNVRACLDPSWNSLERYREGDTALLHYTDMHTQPWVSCDNPNGYLWIRDLFEAIEAGAITRAYVEEHVKRGWVRPSLLVQVDERIQDPLRLSGRVRDLDREFRAPFTELGTNAGAWTNSANKIRAAARHYYQKSLIYRIERRLRSRFAR